MKTTQIVSAAIFVAGCLALHMAQAQKLQIARTELTRRDLGDSIREVIQIRVDFPQGASFPRHSHPGVEVAYVLQGQLVYQLYGEPPITLKAGEALFIPAGAEHSARNFGGGAASELATYVVEKGRPLVVIQQSKGQQ